MFKFGSCKTVVAMYYLRNILISLKEFAFSLKYGWVGQLFHELKNKSTEGCSKSQSSQNIN